MTQTADVACPACGSQVAAHDSFCEACGHELTPTESAESSTIEEVPITLSRSVRGSLTTDFDDIVSPPRPCGSCGGEVGEDGYCSTCGVKAPRERDHYTEQPASWVAACCDRGVRHHRNEDATACAADPDPSGRAVLVVCDGVSTSTDSDVASLAAARAARDVLVAQRASGLGVPASRVAALTKAVVSAAAQANAAVIDAAGDVGLHAGDPAHSEAAENAPSCTFTAVLVQPGLLVFGNVGDSRAYWIPEPGSGVDPVLLTTDDSLAQERIAAGVPRAVAEAGPQAHAITKWLGPDTPDPVPSTGSSTIEGPGWVLACSDGLWNYASEAVRLQALIAELTKDVGSDPLLLAEALVAWACDQGGKDNVSVALARHTGHPSEGTSPSGLADNSREGLPDGR
jgi:serine/threonine protein phosphatase PrpC